MKKKLSIKFMLTVILSFVLFCMPAGAYFANGSHAAEVHAQEETEVSSPEEKAEDENTEEKNGEEDGYEHGSSEKEEPPGKIPIREKKNRGKTIPGKTIRKICVSVKKSAGCMRQIRIVKSAAKIIRNVPM